MFLITISKMSFEEGDVATQDPGWTPDESTQHISFEEGDIATQDPGWTPDKDIEINIRHSTQHRDAISINIVPPEETIKTTPIVNDNDEVKDE